MLRDVMPPQENVSHQKRARNGNKQQKIARTASRTLLHGGMSPEKSNHTHQRAQDRNKPRAGGGCTELERRQTTVVATETHLSNM